MPTTIKNIHKIAHLLSESDIVKIEKGAALHKRHSSITFKVLTVDDSTITISVIQGKSNSEIYLNAKELIQRAKDLFSKFLPGHKLNIGPIVYTPNPISLIDSKWLNSKMLEHGVRAKDIVNDTGIDKTNVSAWVNDLRPMGQPIKAMFYYYFMLKSSGQ
jgi:hypothetical protein